MAENIQEIYRRETIEKEKLIIQINAEIAGRDFLPEEHGVMCKYGNIIWNEINEIRLKNDPEVIKRKHQWYDDVEKVFKNAGFTLIFRQVIPNEYSNSNYYPPWYLVTTTEGIFKVGPRKRVYVIDYSEIKDAPSAKVLFANEDTTKEDFMIHAWGLEKFEEYLTLIHKAL